MSLLFMYLNNILYFDRLYGNNYDNNYDNYMVIETMNQNQTLYNLEFKEIINLCENNTVEFYETTMTNLLNNYTHNYIRNCNHDLERSLNNTKEVCSSIMFYFIILIIMFASK